MSKISNTKLNIIECYCPHCKCNTNHSVLGEGFNTYNNDDEGLFEQDIYRIVECCGCNRVSFNLEKSGSEYEMSEDESGGPCYGKEMLSYPEPEPAIEPIGNTECLPQNVHILYAESVKVLNFNCNLSAMICLRATVEAICKDKGIEGKYLSEMITDLGNKKFVTEIDVSYLQKIRLFGNKSAHETKIPELRQLKAVLIIVNNLLNDLYILPQIYKDEFPNI